MVLSLTAAFMVTNLFIAILIVGTLSQRYGDFLNKHVAADPQHASRDKNYWTSLMRRRVGGRNFNSFIAVSNQGDVQNDFHMVFNNQVRYAPKDTWTSQNARVIYEVDLRANKVQRCVNAKYDAGLERKRNSNKTPIPGRPNHFERRVGGNCVSVN